VPPQVRDGATQQPQAGAPQGCKGDILEDEPHIVEEVPMIAFIPITTTTTGLIEDSLPKKKKKRNKKIPLTFHEAITYFA
jgi:hypothetical protein